MFRGLADDGAAPGIAYGVVGRTGLIHAGGHGVVRENGPRPDAATAFRIASMTKSFTAASILLLAERGALSLADPVGRHVPEFSAVRLPTSDSPQVTVGMLASMSGGLPEDDAWADRQESMSREEFARLLTGGVRFVTVPGTAYEYSNLGYALLGRVVEAASGMTYHDFVDRHLLRPLGMAATGFDTSVPAPGGVATGHARLDGRWRPEPFSGPGVFSAIGGLFSTVEDLARWMCRLAAAFPARDGADPGPLSRAARRDMQQVHRAVPPARGTAAGHGPARVGYGYGLNVEHDPVWGTVVSHSGGYPGFGSHMRWHPGTGLGVVALTNARYVTGKAQATAALRTLLADAAGTGGRGGPGSDGPHAAGAGTYEAAVRIGAAPTTAGVTGTAGAAGTAGIFGTARESGAAGPAGMAGPAATPADATGAAVSAGRATVAAAADAGTRDGAAGTAGTGADPAARLAESPVLWPETIQARTAVERLLRAWDPAVATAWFAANVEMDLDLAHRRAIIEELAAAAGPLLEADPAGGIVRSDSAAHVVWRVRGARGALRCEIRLTPQHPPKIQSLDVTLDGSTPSPAGSPAAPETATP